MTDEIANTPGQQDNPGQQAPGEAGNGAPAGYVEQARYNGLVRKVEELTLENRKLTDQLAQTSSNIEQLKGQLAVKDTEKQVAVGERDTRLTQALQEVAQLTEQVKTLKGLELKVKVARDLKRPELLEIADRIPAVEDEEALKTIMQDFASFADGLVKKREEQLLAGVTLPTGPGSMGEQVPQSAKAWEQKVNDLPLGSPERAKALDAYGDWLEKQHSK